MGIHLPRWVWLGAGALAGVAGMVNVIGFLGFEHQAITHLTTDVFGFAANTSLKGRGAPGRLLRSPTPGRLRFPGRNSRTRTSATCCWAGVS